MKQKHIIIAVIIIILAAIGIYLVTSKANKDSALNTKHSTKQAELKGNVSYPQRIALPAGSIVEVKLQDTSRADAPALVLSENTITTTGENVPIPFTLGYESAKIDERNSYSVSARITINGVLAWISTTNIPVITRGGLTSDIEIIVSPVSDSTPSNPSTPEVGTSSPIVGTKWVWVKTTYPNKDELLAPAGEKYVLSLNDDQTVGSTTDCNGLGGNFSVDGEVLSFSQFISTMRYCEGSLEQQYSNDLSQTTSYAINGNELKLNTKQDVATLYFVKR